MPIVNGSYVAPTWVNDAPPAIDADELNAISQTAESILLPKITITTEDAYTSITATNGADTITLTNNSGTWTGWFTNYGTWTVTAEGSSVPGVATVEVDTVKEYAETLTSVPSDINGASWDEISTIAQSGAAGSFWSVGDTKAVNLSGTVGTLSLDATLYVYIIGFNHRDTIGITFQGFKTSQTDGISVALVDSHYGSTSTDGSLWFNMSHWYNANYGGWAGCDLRYDILGSTDVAPSGYGSAPQSSSRVGYDASATTATSPVANTLMAALPNALRLVMKPMAIYTSNGKGNQSAQYVVTQSIDYLPLLAEFEIFGSRTSANQYEQDNQTQYAYYSSGNSKVKYRHSSTGSTANWWDRSPTYTGNTYFCYISTTGSSSSNSAASSYGLAPIFLV